ncbi:MAG: MaoC family dehydratase N-terminal domain-containing protein [Lachnospiraceae bacterium]|nr:MaoC family dehydratase N-terminal domain-containing protein [Lachnospiraceae bacterium]
MYFDDFKLNETISIEPVVIDKEEMIAFAKRYDNIPLHTDVDYAKGTHFGQLIAPGVMSFMSVWASYRQVDLAGEELLAGKSTKIEWFKPVFAGDELSSEVVVTKLTGRNEKNGIVEITFYVKNQNGDLVLTNVTEMIVKRKR